MRLVAFTPRVLSKVRTRIGANLCVDKSSSVDELVIITPQLFNRVEHEIPDLCAFPAVVVPSGNRPLKWKKCRLFGSEDTMRRVNRKKGRDT